MLDTHKPTFILVQYPNWQDLDGTQQKNPNWQDLHGSY